MNTRDQLPKHLRDLLDEEVTVNVSVSAKAQRRQARKAEKEEPKRSKPFEPMNARQADLMAALDVNLQIFVLGPAGTGKTYVTARHAVRRINIGQIERIVICRPAVSKPKHRLGFRPGNSDEKMGPWLVPVLDGIRAEVGAAGVEKLCKSKQIEFLPFEEMRGRSLEDSVIILDEAQNCDIGDLKLFLTRVGRGSQVVVCGDMDQVDIPDSGLRDVVDMARRYKISATLIEFTDDEVVRSGIAKEWVKAFAAESETNRQIA